MGHPIRHRKLQAGRRPWGDVRDQPSPLRDRDTHGSMACDGARPSDASARWRRNSPREVGAADSALHSLSNRVRITLDLRRSHIRYNENVLAGPEPMIQLFLEKRYKGGRDG